MKKLIILLFFYVYNPGYASGVTYVEYLNARFNYQVTYPDFLIAEGEASNGSGQNFIWKKATLTVYGSFFPDLDSQKNEDGFNLQAEFNYEIKELSQQGYKLDYTFSKGNEFVMTGSNSDQTVYLKKVFVQPCGVHIYLWLYYPKEEKKSWDQWVKIISESFKYQTKTCQGDFIPPE